MFISEAMAASTAAAPAQGPLTGFFLQLILVFGIFYFLLIRPQQKKMKEHEDMLKAREFFMRFYNLENVKLCIENPRAMARCNLPPYSQVIQPFQFGEPYSKQTLLWLKGLPYLIPDCYTINKRVFGRSWCEVQRSACQRSKTFYGVARAMAKQWG